MAFDFQLPKIKSTNRGSISKEVLEVAEADVRFIMAHIANTEVQNQIRLKNPPSHSLVDKRPSIDYESVRSDIRVFFNNAKLVLIALKDAWNMLMGPARVKTGYTKRQFEVWVNDRRVGDSPDAVTETMITPDDTVRIVGPMVAHTRKYIHLVGGKQFTKKNRKTKAQTTIDLYTGVVRQIKRRYRTLRINVSWVEHANLNPTGKVAVTRVPGMAIYMTKRGALGGE